MKNIKHLFWGTTLLSLVFCVVGNTKALAAGGKSDFAILTGKEGMASGLAHRHIVVAQEPAVTVILTYAPGATKATQLPTGGTADVKVQAKTLIVDDMDASKAVRGLYTESGVWGETDKLDSSIRDKVTENMVSESQLDVEHSPTITGSGTFSECQPDGVSAKCKLSLSVTIRGTTVTKALSMRLSRDGSGVVGQFVAPFTFTEFGIKPYSAMLGAIRVSDEFHLAAIVRAE